MLTPDDATDLETLSPDEEFLRAELVSVYAKLDHLILLVDALYGGVCGLIEALTPLPEVPGLSPVAAEHLRLALREAKGALRLADTLEEVRYA